MNKKEILLTLFKQFNETEIVLVILFGNRGGLDVDIFVLLMGTVTYGNISIGNLDVSYVGSYWLENLIYNLDPIITEPIMTGEVLYGDQSFIDKTKLRFRVKDCVPIYLYRNARLFYDWTRSFVEEGQLKKALINISFVYSYLMFARDYQNIKNVLTYKELSDKYPKLKMVKSAIKIISVSMSEVTQLMIEVEKELTELQKELEF